MKIEGNFVYIEKKDLNQKGEIVYTPEQEDFFAKSSKKGEIEFIFDEVRDELKTLSFPKIGSFAIWNPIAYFPKLETATINGICYLSDYNFYHCPNLKKVIFAEQDNVNRKLHSMGYSCFSYCESLKQIEFPKSFGMFDAFCFEHNKNLEAIRFNGSLSKSMFDEFDPSKPIEKKFRGILNNTSLKELYFGNEEDSKRFYLWAVKKEPEMLLLANSELFSNEFFYDKCLIEIKESLYNKFRSDLVSDKNFSKATYNILKDILDKKTKLEEEKLLNKENAFDFESPRKKIENKTFERNK